MLVLPAIGAVQAPAARAATEPTTAPTTVTSADISPTRIDEAVRQLGDRDFRVRERATRTLWAAGAAAEPALRRALQRGDVDPETLRRIRTILSNLAFGITPDMSDEVVALMGEYRTGDAAARRAAALSLARHGAAGARVLLRLRGEERDPQTRDFIAGVLLRQSRELAVALVGDGDVTSAARVLELAAHNGGGAAAASNYAALLLVTGGLDDAIAATRKRLDNAPTDARKDDHDPSSAPPEDLATLLALLCRANGDLPAARAAAERSGDDALVRNVLIEIGDWRELARRSDAAGLERATIEDLSFAAAFHRLAGDEAAVDGIAERLGSAANREPEESWHAAEALLLNGRVDQGIELLVRHGHLAAAVDFQTQRLALAEIPRLMERAAVRQGPQLGEVEAKAARAAWFAGDVKSAAEALDAAADRAATRHDLNGLVAAVGIATDMGLTEKAWWYTTRAMQTAQRGQQPLLPVPDGVALPLTDLFERARFRDPERAAGWWQVLRFRFPRHPAGKTLETLRAIDERRMPADDLQALCDTSADAAKRLQPGLREAHVQLVAETLDAFGRREQAADRYAELAERARASGDPDRAVMALSKLADFDADAGRWRDAADKYYEAWSSDRANPVPLFLSGWSLGKAGDAAAGAERMRRARAIPLADQNRRYDLHDAMLRCKLPDDAGRERGVILRTAEFLSWRRSEALRRAGDDARAAGDALGAAELWERAFLDNNSRATRFVEPWANVSMPALIRRTRAIGLVRAGRVTEGLREADACLAAVPGDADSLIEVVAALDETKHGKEADALYARVAGRYKKLAAEHPQSGPLNNLYAWSAAKCRRELDAALDHARRAVTLQPRNTASLDTLAETHFQRGETDQAIAAMQRCVELEPDEPHHKEQLARFQKATIRNAPLPTTRP